MSNIDAIDFTNISLDNLKQTAAEIVENMAIEKPFQKFENVEIKKQIPIPVEMKVQEIKPKVLPEITQIKAIEKSINVKNIFTIGGFDIPKQTIYLIIFVVIFSIILWYFTRKPQKENQEKENK